MTRIIKKYWKWDDILSPEPYKLGYTLDDYLDDNLILNDQDLEYPGLHSFVKGYPSRILFKAEKVFSISFRDTFFPIEGSSDIWDLPYKEFCDRLNGIVDPSEDDKQGDKLYVVFRGGFVSMAMLIRY